MIEQNRQRGLNLRFWRRDLAVDLGTTNTLIYMPRRGMYCRNRLWWLARQHCRGGGEKGRAHARADPGGIRAVKPLQSGVIADYDLARKMLEHFISRVLRRFPF